MNAIYIEYGIHQGENCYKIDNPWTLYAKEAIILCTVKQGLEEAKRLARDLVSGEFLDESLKQTVIFK